MDAGSLNLPRWPAAPAGGFHEVWFVSASDPGAGLGLWLRYTVDVGPHGRTCAVWGCWFDRDHSDRCIALKNGLDAAAIGRTGVDLGGNVLSASRCIGEVEGDARLALDGVVHAAPGHMVQVSYADALHCANTEIADLEVRVRTRALPGAAWRPEITLTSKCSSSLEFCGRTPFLKVTRGLVAVPAVQKEGLAAGSVAG